ncbi:MAG TPA: DUF2461 domain-containing protein [Chitinophagales bacterium]|nr:DUF2461 domain-containing protein [Chitinophagales bacterium]
MELYPKTLRFLAQLKKNNNREWFEAHRADYDAVRGPWEEFVGALIADFSERDARLVGLEAKQCLFRIYRDVRFSNDKTPYKKHLSATIAPGGRKSPLPGFYVHIEPNGETWVGGGLWRPEAQLLKKVRQEIDYNWGAFRAITSTKAFAKTFGEPHNDKLTRPPAGYDSSNPAVEVLRYKSFVYGRSCNDVEVLKPSFFNDLVKTHEQLLPFFEFLNSAVDH